MQAALLATMHHHAIKSAETTGQSTGPNYEQKCQQEFNQGQTEKVQARSGFGWNYFRSYFSWSA